MSDYILQRRSLIQILLITLLALILTVSLILGGVLLWQGRADAPDQTPVVGLTPSPSDVNPILTVTSTDGGFRVQGTGWPGFAELTLSLVPRGIVDTVTATDLGAVVANAKGVFNVQFPWSSVPNRGPGLSYDLVAAGDSNRVATPFNVAPPAPGVTPSVEPPLATATPQPTPAPAEAACSVVADALNVRSGPDVVYQSVAGITYGTSVRPLARTSASDWLQIALDDGSSGWVVSAYLECNINVAGLPVVQAPQPTPVPNPALAGITVAPAQGWAGTNVTVSGINWTPGSVVFISLGMPNGAATTDVYAQAAAGSDGLFSAGFTFPAEDRWLSQQQVIVVAHTADYSRSATALFGLMQPAPQITDWKGEYFANRTLSGAPVLVRNDSSGAKAQIDFNWGSAAPASGLPANNFSVRWTRSLSFAAGDYRFYARTDDGVRIWVDNWPVVDQWNDGGAGLRSGDFKAIGAGNHTIRIEYYDNSGDAFATIWWERIGPITDWKGEYFNNVDLSGLPVLVRNETNIDFNWGTGSPASDIPSNNFSARWTQRMAFVDGMYRFSVRADDGVRLWVDGRSVLDQWHDSDSQTYTADVSLAKGAHEVQVEYYERSGGAMIQVAWKRIGDRPAIQPLISLVIAENQQQFVVSGSNWPAGMQIQLSLAVQLTAGDSAGSAEIALGPVVADLSGKFKAPYAMPDVVSDGMTLVARGGKFEIQVPFVPTDGSTLPGGGGPPIKQMPSGGGVPR